jgi:hypothetical protein
VFPVRFERIFISQKTASFIGTAVKTWNLTHYICTMYLKLFKIYHNIYICS